MNISKELLNAVLGDEYNVERLCEWYEIEDGYLKTHYDCGKYDLQGRPTGLGIEINIHELAHKCKEWAYSQGYILFSKIRLSSSLASCYFDTMGKYDYEDEYYDDFRAETESEAIFKACHWILDNK